jgi:hypothetical protein
MNNNKLILDDQPFKVVIVLGPTSAPGYVGNVRRDVAALIAKESADQEMALVQDGFNIEMRERCHAAFKLYAEDGLPVPWFQFENCLNDPTDFFNGMSPEAAYASFQSYVHTFMADSIMGQWVVERCNYYRNKQKELAPDARAKGVILADVASVADYKNVIESYGVDNATLIQVRCKGGIDLTAAIAPNLRTGRLAQIEFTEDKDQLTKAIREAAPHLFIKIARTFEV